MGKVLVDIKGRGSVPLALFFGAHLAHNAISMRRFEYSGSPKKIKGENPETPCVSTHTNITAKEGKRPKMIFYKAYDRFYLLTHVNKWTVIWIGLGMMLCFLELFRPAIMGIPATLLSQNNMTGISFALRVKTAAESMIAYLPISTENLPGRWLTYLGALGPVSILLLRKKLRFVMWWIVILLGSFITCLPFENGAVPLLHGLQFLIPTLFFLAISNCKGTEIEPYIALFMQAFLWLYFTFCIYNQQRITLMSTLYIGLFGLIVAIWGSVYWKYGGHTEDVPGQKTAGA